MNYETKYDTQKQPNFIIRAFNKVFDDIWEGLFYCLVCSIVTCGITFIWLGATADHRIRQYYLDSSESSSVGFCVYGEINWQEDRRAFCSDDINKVLDVLQRANASLKGK